MYDFLWDCVDASSNYGVLDTMEYSNRLVTIGTFDGLSWAAIAMMGQGY